VIVCVVFDFWGAVVFGADAKQNCNGRANSLKFQ